MVAESGDWLTAAAGRLSAADRLAAATLTTGESGGLRESRLSSVSEGGRGTVEEEMVALKISPLFRKLYMFR